MTTTSTRPVTAPTPPATGRARRVGLVLVALAFAGMFGLPGLPSLFTAWSSADLDGAHRLHLLAQGWHGLVLLVGAVALLRARWRTAGAHLLLVGLLPAIVVAAAAGMLPSPAAAAPPLLLLALLVALLPDRGDLRRVRPSAPLLTLAAGAAIGLGLFAVQSLRLQLVLPPTEPHAAVEHWGGMAVFALTLAGLALMAALRAAGWRLVLWTVGASVAVWGLASAASPTHPSSLGLGWGLVAAAGAAAFVALGERSSRSTPLT